LGRVISFSMFNINYHGVHHRYAKIPQARLPEFTALLEPHHPGERPAYSSYASAFLEMVRGLGDPRVGSQWLACADVEPEPALMAGAGQHS
jgi:fatty acid desaturase